MFNFRIIQAEQGDCSILEYGDELHPRFIIIDGGPKGTYSKHLKPEISKIHERQGVIEYIIVSHVCNDHIRGIIELFNDFSNIRGLPEIHSVWHNTFSQTIDTEDNIENRLFTIPKINREGNLTRGIKDGHELINLLEHVGIPINPETDGNPISIETLSNKINCDNLDIQVIGPTEENLQELREEWLEWLENLESNIETDNTFFRAMTDGSFQNLSSIMLLAEAEGKRILLTGDGRGDHIIRGLEKLELLSQGDIVKVDIMKVPHHGSSRNVTKEFFERIPASTYVISGNGMYGNPDFDTLKWIVEVSKEREETVRLFLTNCTESSRKLRDEFDPTEFYYELEIMYPQVNSVNLI